MTWNRNYGQISVQIQTSETGRIRSVWRGVYTSWTSGTMSIKGCKGKKGCIDDSYIKIRFMKKQTVLRERERERERRWHKRQENF